MNNSDLSVVTGAFGYTGKYITAKLLTTGHQVRTLTFHPGRTSPFGDQVKAYPLDFDDPNALAQNLGGARTLYNTYWIRFPRGRVTFENAVENTKTLINAALDAGVQRIVHLSVANPSPSSPLAYFKGKALVEEAIIRSGLTYSIIRPTLIFGSGDILINNIAWSLRKFPFFPIPGKGDYPVQPVFVEDVAEMAVSAGNRGENEVLDCAGPEIFAYNQLIRTIADGIGSNAKVVHVPSLATLMISKLAGYLVKDIVLTKAEIDGLMAGLLVSADSPVGRMSLASWLGENHQCLGNKYISELDRHYRPEQHRDNVPH